MSGFINFIEEEIIALKETFKDDPEPLTFEEIISSILINWNRLSPDEKKTYTNKTMN
jgi:hypothetical protein